MFFLFYDESASLKSNRIDFGSFKIFKEKGKLKLGFFPSFLDFIIIEFGKRVTSQFFPFSKIEAALV